VSGEAAIQWLTLLCAWSVLLQTVEYWRIADSVDPTGVWSWPVQRADIPDTPGGVKKFLDWVYQPSMYRAQLLIRGLAAIGLALWGAQLSVALVLFLGQLLLLVRWRGAFNGGSDFMTLVSLTGILLAQVLALFLETAMAWAAGLGYIAIHTLSSYFVSGWVKVKRSEWRSGRALTVFLNSGLFGPLSADSVFRKSWLALVCSWAFILWEGVFPLVLFKPDWVWVFGSVALIFHFLVFWFFGLNRFFWAWAANLSSLFFLANLLGNS
jgi:hypothetical protein